MTGEDDDGPPIPLVQLSVTPRDQHYADWARWAGQMQVVNLMIPAQLLVPDGLTAAEAADLECDLWTPFDGPHPWDPGHVKARGCLGHGHHLCRSCASLDRDRSPMLDDDRWSEALDAVPFGWDD